MYATRTSWSSGQETGQKLLFMRREHCGLVDKKQDKNYYLCDENIVV